MTDAHNNKQHRFIIKGESIVSGRPVSGTLYFGDAFSNVEKRQDSSPKSCAVSPRAEMHRIEKEIALVVKEINSIGDMLRREGFEDEAEILFTHTIMLQDNSIRARIERRIKEKGDGAEDAVASVFGEMKELLLQSENAITSERAADVEDLMQRLQNRFSRKDVMYYSAKGMKEMM